MKKTNVFKNPLLFLFPLWHVLSAGLLLLLLMVDTRAGIFLAPIFEFSITGLAAILEAVLATGFIGFYYSSKGVSFLPSFAIANALPIIAMIAYTVLIACGSFESDASVIIGALGNGLFTIVSQYVSIIAEKTLSFYEPFVSFVALLASFIVGYSIGGAKQKKS